MIFTSLQEISVVFYVANKYSIHAEQNCISKVKNKAILKQCTLILVCPSCKGTLIECKPCDMCWHIINKYKINRVITVHN